MTNIDASMRLRWDAPAAPSLDRAMLVHDIRCAIQGVSGAASLLEAEEALAPGLRVQLLRIAEAARQLNDLVDALVGDAAEETAADPAAPRTELADLLSRIERLWSGEAVARGIVFRLDKGPNLPSALAVELWPLLRVLGNLVCNAMKHSGSAEVELALRRGADGGLEIAVRDRGLGLPEGRIVALRQPGRIACVGADGHGLGLGIARDLCNEVGSAFRLVNRPEGGVEATVVLPQRLCLEAEPGLGEEAEPGKEGGDAPTARRAGLSGRRILLAEDNHTNQIVATQMLRALEAEVILASDGVDALERFEEGEFDLVIVDIEMPRLSGLDVIRAIRARGDARARVPIVALTAYAMREHRDRIAHAGADGLISKPLTSIGAFGAALAAHLAPDAVPDVAHDPDVLSPSGAPAEAATAQEEEPVADQAVFEALCRAIGQDMMAELLEKVVADLSQAQADLAAALSPLDRKPIRSASHILISVAGAIGAVRLQHCARLLNTSAHGEKEAELPAQVRRCMDEIDAAVAFANSQRRT